jgi:hypothetical protein
MPMKEIKIDLVPMFVRPSFRTKEICLTMDDLGRIGDDLSVQFPTIRFMRKLTDAEWRGEARPGLRIESNLRSALASLTSSDEISVFFEPHLQLNLRQELYKTFDGESYPVWRYNIPGLPHLRMIPSGYPNRGWDGKGPERLSRTKIDFAGEPGNKNHLALAQQIFGIIRRQVKKEPLLCVDYPSYESHPPIRDTRLEWITRDAMRWAREDPKRLLVPDIRPDGAGWGYRPVD